MKKIEFENPMFLVEETKLDKEGFPFIKAKGAHSFVGPVTKVEGPSLYITWLPLYGAPPRVGDFIRVNAEVVEYSDLYGPPAAFPEPGTQPEGVAEEVIS